MAITPRLGLSGKGGRERVVAKPDDQGTTGSEEVETWTDMGGCEVYSVGTFWASAPLPPSYLLFEFEILSLSLPLSLSLSLSH